MEGLLSGGFSNSYKKNSQFYFKGSNIPSNKYVDLIESDDDMLFSPPTEKDFKQKKIKRLTLNNDFSSMRNDRLNSMNKSDLGVRSLQNKKK